MPSPFPGMNPYLEQNDTWGDFHTNFIVRMRETLSAHVGPNYFVKIEVQKIMHELSAEERRQPEMPAVEIERHSALEIRDRRNRRVVTVLELLSPSNKTPGPDRDDYLAKRRQVLAGMTHLVEIDLRRGGHTAEPAGVASLRLLCAGEPLRRSAQGPVLADRVARSIAIHSGAFGGLRWAGFTRPSFCSRSRLRCGRLRQVYLRRNTGTAA